jgi:hypothetical protein
MPSAAQADEVVATMLAMPTTQTMGYREPLRPYQDFSTLRYPIYLTPLVKLAAAGHVEVLSGIGVIPTPDATRALIGLIDRPDRAVAHAAAQQLAMRLPDPALDGALPGRTPFSDEYADPRRYLRDASWRPEFVGDVRAAARKLLTSPDMQDVVQGAFMLEAIGDAGDGPALSGALTVALERTLTLAFEKGGYPRPRGAMAELMRAAEVLTKRGYVPPANSTEPGDAAMWLVTFRHGSRPDGWEDRLDALLGHRIPYLRELSLKQLPADSPRRLLDHVGPALAEPDIDLEIAGCEVAMRLRLVEHRATIAGIVRRARTADTMLLNFAMNALSAVGGRAELYEILAARLLDEDVRNEVIGRLFGVFDEVRGFGGGFTDPAGIPAVSARWVAFITAHRAEIDAGKHFSLEDPAVTPDLVPRGWKLSRPGKPDWPPGR